MDEKNPQKLKSCLRQILTFSLLQIILTNDIFMLQRQQHDQAQKNAESLQKKEYPVQKPASKDENAKNDKVILLKIFS